jgi:hypothetical protein
MKLRSESLTVTLHWFAGEAEHVSTVVCEDGAPAQLIPLLLAGCGLPHADGGGRPLRYALHLGAPTGPQLRDSEPASRQGLRSGGHLWLTEQGRAWAPRCALALPGGDEFLVPQPGLALSRGWLLQMLALLNPAAHRSELELLERRASSYRYVSSRPHCAIGPDRRGGWAVGSDRADVATRLNDAHLAPGAPATLRGGDRLTLGDEGPTLKVMLLGETSAG